MPSIFEDAGFKLPTSEPAKGPVAESAKKDAAPVSIFTAAGFKVPTKSAPEPAPAIADNIPTPEKFARDYPGHEGKASGPAQLPNPGELVVKGASNTAHDILENAAAGWQKVKEGVSEIREGKSAPSYTGEGPAGTSTNLLGETKAVPGLPQYAPGGVLKTLGGLAAIPGSLISGPVNALVTRPVTEITGSPEIGDRAGAVANALIPLKGGGKAAEVAAPSTRANNALVKAIGPENVPEVVAGMRANPRMTAADLSDPVRLTTQGLMAGGTPDVQDFISRAVRERTATRLENTNSAYTAAMGPKPDVGIMVEGLKQKARDAGREAIQPALEKASPVDVSPVVKAINEKLKPGVNPLLDPGTRLPMSAEQEALARFKQQLTASNGETLFDAKRLHQVQSDIGDQAYQLSKSPDPKDRRLGSQLRDMNEKLIDRIDTASNGAYRPARQKFKDAKDISAAFESGFDTLKNRSGLEGALEDSPDALRKWMKDATQEEVVARRIGTRADMDQKINGVKNGALAGQTVTAIPYNREKLQVLFGDKEANRLIGVMGDAQREAATNAAIFSGSKTAETKAAADRIAVRKVGGGNPLQYVAPVAAEMLGQSAGLPGAGLAASLAAKGVHMTAQKIGQLHDIAKNMEFAKGALATGPAREKTINALLSHPKVISELKKRSNALTSP